MAVAAGAIAATASVPVLMRPEGIARVLWLVLRGRLCGAALAQLGGQFWAWHAAFLHGVANGRDMAVLFPGGVQTVFDARTVPLPGQFLGPALVEVVAGVRIGAERHDIAPGFDQLPGVVAVLLRELLVAQGAVVFWRVVRQGSRVFFMHGVAQRGLRGFAGALAGIDVFAQRVVHIVFVEFGVSGVGLLPAFFDAAATRSRT